MRLGQGDSRGMNEAYEVNMDHQTCVDCNGVRTSNAAWTCGADVSGASKSRWKRYMPECTSCRVIRDKFVILSTVSDSGHMSGMLSYKDWPCITIQYEDGLPRRMYL